METKQKSKIALKRLKRKKRVLNNKHTKKFILSLKKRIKRAEFIRKKYIKKFASNVKATITKRNWKASRRETSEKRKSQTIVRKKKNTVGKKV